MENNSTPKFLYQATERLYKRILKEFSQSIDDYDKFVEICHQVEEAIYDGEEQPAMIGEKAQKAPRIDKGFKKEERPVNPTNKLRRLLEEEADEEEVANLIQHNGGRKNSKAHCHYLLNNGYVKVYRHIQDLTSISGLVRLNKKLKEEKKILWVDDILKSEEFKKGTFEYLEDFEALDAKRIESRDYRLSRKSHTDVDLTDEELTYGVWCPVWEFTPARAERYYENLEGW